MIKQGISLLPLDTFFFRGAEPMEAGENHFVSNVFPPMPSTITGALRTAMLVRNEISFRHFIQRIAVEQSSSVDMLLGTPDQAGFRFSGPLFLIEMNGQQTPIVPAPAHWYADKEKLRITDYTQELLITEAKPISSSAKEYGLCSSTYQQTYSFWHWACPKGDEELKSLEGHWVTVNALNNLGRLTLVSKVEDLIPDQPQIIHQNALFSEEIRVGIARNNFEKTTIQGRLYSSNHIRMSDGVRLLLLPDKDLVEALGESGVLQLGGEQRVAQYEIQELEIPRGKDNSTKWLALSPVKSSLVKDYAPAGVASGKLRRIGGWEMKKGGGDSGNNRGFHREMEGWHPAGTVLFFNEPKAVPHGWWGL